MKTKEKLSDKVIQETWEGLSEGLKPMKDNFDPSDWSKADREDILKQLDELEAKALEVKAALNR